MEIEKERERFEEWITKELYRPVRDRDGEYQDDEVYERWEAWLARAALDQLPPLIDLSEPTPPTSD